MKRRFTILTAALALLTFLAVPMGMWGQTTMYEQLTSIANIDENAQYVLGIDGTGFHYEGTSSWGKTALPSAQTPIYYTLTKANDGNSFTAQAIIDNTTYYLQVPTSNTFSMATSTGTNTDLIIGTTQVSGTNYAVANKTTTNRHLRINGTSGLRSYAGTTGTMAFFYRVVTGTSYTVTYYANVDGTDPIEATYFEGATVTVAPNTFVNPGYAFTEWNTEEDGTGDSYSPDDEIENINADIDLYAQWEVSYETVDELTYEFTGIYGTSYDAWSNTGASGAVYAGRSGGNYNSIQLNNSSPNGIVSTTSGGKVTKVVITWNSNTSNGRSVDIYGSNTAYEGSADLYDTNKQGTKLGSIVKGTSTTLTISGDYSYIGIRNPGSAVYLDKVEITWSTVPSTNPSITIDPSTVNATAAETNGTLSVTYIDIDSEAGVEIHWFDAAGQRIQNGYDWMDAELDDNWNIYYTIGANDGEARTAYLKIYGVDEDVNDVYSNLVTITQEAFVPLFIGADPSTIEVGCQGTDNGNFEVLFDERLQSPYGSSVVLCFYDENDNQINDDPEWFQYQYIQDYHSFEYTISENTSTEPRTARMKIKYTDPYTTATIFSDYILINQDAYEAPSLTGTITFGSAQGSTSINSTSVTGKDSMGNTWTITTTFDGEESFTPQPGYAQVGSAKKPASSITFTTTLPEVKTITSFEAKFGGFSGTAGAINLFVDESTVGTGVLNEAEDVVVNSTAAEGTVLTVTVTNIAKGVKCYYISYTLEEATPAGPSITVNGYGDTDGGYVLLAWPENISPANIEGMISDDYGAQLTPETPGTYDLYYYDESQEMEWRNYRTNSFNLVPGKGYLYASKDGVTLTYEGEANPEFADVDNLPYTENDLVKSLYLAGNSKTTTETFYVYDNDNYYDQIAFNYLVMNEDGNGFTSHQATSFEAQPLQGFFVQAPKANTILSTADLSDADGVSLLNLQVMRNRGTVVDNAIVSFSNGPTMKKLQLFENSTKLYIPQDDEDYAIVRSEAQGELPVSFRASENGTYTLSMNVENVDMNYLHLIDNMTGMDIDLLQTPSYTFEANTNDYANRFKLVFAANSTDEADESSFAFFSNGNLIVNNEGNATLQVIDINGRILSSETISGSCSKAVNATTGVYMLRLINGDNVKVQKVVVR